MSMIWSVMSGKKGVVTLIAVTLLTVSMLLYYSDMKSQHSLVGTVNDMSAIKLSTESIMRTAAISDDDFIDDNFGPVNFDINGSDVVVFLHIQKTGGTNFGRHLAENLDLAKECEIFGNMKEWHCFRPNSETETWLLSRYSTGWLCGVHSDWTELDECDKDGRLDEFEKHTNIRKYFQMTILRYPVDRYLSEYSHVKRGATWKTTLHACQHHVNNIPRCFEGNDWRGLSLEEFISCPFNMARNRQTRMLANLRLVNCYERWLNGNLTQKEIMQMEDTMLESAKENLKNMAFFGITEKQVAMQALFEYTFGLKFKMTFFQHMSTPTRDQVISEDIITTIKELNHLDMDLYYYAKRLFHSRYRGMLKTKSKHP